MVDRDFDEEAKHGASPQQTDNKMNESLGMDGIDIVLEDYSQGAAAQDSGQPSTEERKQAPMASMQGGEKSKLQQWCPWLSPMTLAPYF